MAPRPGRDGSALRQAERVDLPSGVRGHTGEPARGLRPGSRPSRRGSRVARVRDAGEPLRARGGDGGSPSSHAGGSGHESVTESGQLHARRRGRPMRTRRPCHAAAWRSRSRHAPAARVRRRRSGLPPRRRGLDTASRAMQARATVSPRGSTFSDALPRPLLRGGFWTSHTTSKAPREALYARFVSWIDTPRVKLICPSLRPAPRCRDGGLVLQRCPHAGAISAVVLRPRLRSRERPHRRESDPLRTAQEMADQTFDPDDTGPAFGAGLAARASCWTTETRPRQGPGSACLSRLNAFDSCGRWRGASRRRRRTAPAYGRKDHRWVRR